MVAGLSGAANNGKLALYGNYTKSSFMYLGFSMFGNNNIIIGLWDKLSYIIMVYNIIIYSPWPYCPGLAA